MIAFYAARSRIGTRPPAAFFVIAVVLAIAVSAAAALVAVRMEVVNKIG